MSSQNLKNFWKYWEESADTLWLMRMNPVSWEALNVWVCLVMTSLMVLMRLVTWAW